MVFLVIAALFLTSCLPTYIVKSGYQQMQILNNKEPIEEVLRKKELSPEFRHKLELTLQIREFAEKRLGLTVTKNYSTFVDLKRPYISWIVTASKRNELSPYLYWYPMVGKLPYKGYFNREEAEEAVRDFDPKQYDTMVRGVTAYSTLGWFNDPLLSTMLDGPDHHLVNLLIHESTHATLYIKSNADFNERLATYVGQIGTQLYYLDREGLDSITLKEIRDDEHDEMIFSKFISEEITKLSEWYKSHPSTTDEERNFRFKKIQDNFKNSIEKKLKTRNYAKFPQIKLNNAILLYYKTYLSDLNDFERLYQVFGQDINQFLAYLKSLEKKPHPDVVLKDFLDQKNRPTSDSPSK